MQLRKCRGYDCPVKEKCLRYTAKPSEHQEWLLLPPIPRGEDCDYYMPTTNAAATAAQEGK